MEQKSASCRPTLAEIDARLSSNIDDMQKGVNGLKALMASRSFDEIPSDDRRTLFTVFGAASFRLEQLSSEREKILDKIKAGEEYA